MKLDLDIPRSNYERHRRIPVPLAVVLCAAVVLIFFIVAKSGGSKAPSAPPEVQTSTTSPAAQVAPPQPIEVPETASIKPGFKDLRWGSAPTGDMRYVGRGEGLTRIYEREADCLKMADESICDISYYYFKKRLFGVRFEENFVTRGAYRPSLLADIESQWGVGTAVPGGKEWRSRDPKYGLTIARWEPSHDSMNTRWEKVTIFSDRIDSQRKKIESNPDSPEMKQLRKEIEKYQQEQRRRDDRYKM